MDSLDPCAPRSPPCPATSTPRPAGCPRGRPWTRCTTALDTWQAGKADLAVYDEAVTASRAAYARLVGVDPSWVAVGSQASALVGLVAASVPDGAEVLTVDGDFASVVFPFLAHADRGVTVRHVPLESLADEIRPSTHTVAFSLVQSVDGRVADVDAVRTAAAAAGAADGLRRHAGRRLAPGGRDRVRRDRVRVLQVAVGTARDRVPHGPARRCSTGCARRAPAGTRARRSGRRSTGPRCRSPGTRAGSTSPPPGCAGWVPSRRSSCSRPPRATPSTAYTVGLADAFRAGVGLPPGGSAIVAAARRRGRLAAGPARGAGHPRGGARRRRPARVPRLERRRRRRAGCGCPEQLLRGT